MRAKHSSARGIGSRCFRGNEVPARGCVHCTNNLHCAGKAHKVPTGRGSKLQPVIIPAVTFSRAESTRGHQFSKRAQPGKEEQADLIRAVTARLFAVTVEFGMPSEQ